MVTRIKLGLRYQYDDNWIGGTYYIQNLLSSLNLLKDESKPYVVIICDISEHFFSLKSKCNYPYLEHRKFHRKLNLFERIINKVVRFFLKKNLFINQKLNSFKDLQIIFPAVFEPAFENNKKLFWIPDLQEHFLPSFFSEEEILMRKQFQLRLIQEGRYVLFSSQAALNNFNEIYANKKLKCFLLPFAVYLNTPDQNQITSALKKFSLPNKFFICCNQFWQHKNHIVILKAVHYLKLNGFNVKVVFTGKENDYRNPKYIISIQNMINELGLAENIIKLGFIDREEQLALMKAATAIIQPSLFEGWSTVIEDAKALNNYVLASDIEVHLEQLRNYPNKKIFKRDDFIELSNLLFELQNGVTVQAYQYYSDQLSFSLHFENILSQILEC